MSDEKYTPRYYEMSDEALRRQIEKYFDPGWMGDRYLKEILKTKDGKWLCVFDTDFMKIIDRNGDD